MITIIDYGMGNVASIEIFEQFRAKSPDLLQEYFTVITVLF